MFVRLYPDKRSPAPAERAVILARSAHAGFGKAKGKAQSKAKNDFCKVFDQTFFKKFAGVGKEWLRGKFHNAFGEIRENHCSFLQTLFN
jgi:hypothetical protein